MSTFIETIAFLVFPASLFILRQYQTVTLLSNKACSDIETLLSGVKQ